MSYQRKTISVLLICVFSLLISVGCGSAGNKPPTQIYSGFSVHYINVGQGDCIFIRLPDGKNMLIDTGDTDVFNKTAEKITAYLNAYSVSKIDYFVLTHPDADHAGNALYLLQRFIVDTAYLPYISQVHLSNYPSYNQAYQELKQTQAKIITSDCYRYVKGDYYQVAFLSPMEKNSEDSSYFHFNGMTVPDESASNDLSPIIYLDACGKRFLFTGDASKSQEMLVVSNYKANLYKNYFGRFGIQVNLSEIDYLKVGHHGARTSSCEDFLNLTKPKNAIISVGGDNYYGHPASETLTRFLECNPNVNLYRTDYHGTVVVHERAGGDLIVSTDAS